MCVTSRFDSSVYAHRLAAAAAATAEAGLAGLVITPGYDLRYLTGSRAQTFERLTALVLPASDPPTMVVPRLELAALRESAVADLGVAVRDWVDGEDPYRMVGEALGGRPATAAVTDAMSALHLLPLIDVLGATPVLATDVLRQLRMIKDPS
ncbi:MAG: aminopeptidase P family N-terminal domain-containing protein, partial [Mycolicibacter algericus]